MGSGMGWRADDAYEKARKEDYQRWRASLSWREYGAWQWRRHKHFLAGAASALVVVGVLLYLTR